jgi:elongation factor G
VAGNKGEEIRNVAIAGHSGSGKTMLAEALLLKGGVLNRLGQVSDGSTASDYDIDEREAGKSYYSTVLHTDWKGRDLNIIDTPGSLDFVGQLYGALSVVELALITVNAASELRLALAKRGS